MRNHTLRLYAGCITVLVFFLLWATIAAHPWSSSPSTPTADRRLLALAARQHRLQREAASIRKLVAVRWTRYDRELQIRRRQIALARARYAQSVAAAQVAARRVVYVSAPATTGSEPRPATVAATGTVAPQRTHPTSTPSAAGDSDADGAGDASGTGRSRHTYAPSAGPVSAATAPSSASPARRTRELAPGDADEELPLSASTLSRHRFRSMGVEIECLVEGDDGGGFPAVEREFRRLDAVFSRFREDSELSRLNAATTARCSEEMLEVVELSLAARERTQGRFDPTVHDAVVAAGYDRTFALVERDALAAERQPPACGGGVHVDRERRVVELEHGARLDLGGIVKGWAAERCCRLLHSAADAPCLVNAAGDIAVRGTPAPGCWPIAADTATGSVTLGLRRGGIATSGRDERRWRRNGEERHHLIDPRTGAPSTSDLVRVTAVGADAVDAEVRAKALFLAGESAALEEAAQEQVPCLLVTEDGRTVGWGGLV